MGKDKRKRVVQDTASIVVDAQIKDMVDSERKQVRAIMELENPGQVDSFLMIIGEEQLDQIIEQILYGVVLDRVAYNAQWN